MNKGKTIGSILGVLFGIFMVLYSGLDDSPGGQVFGLVVIIVSVIILFNKNEDKIEQIKEK